MLLIIGSYRGRKYIDGCVRSVTEHVTGCDRILVVDDSGDAEHRAWLNNHFHWMPVAEANAGYGPAMTTVFNEAANSGGNHFAFVEEDFRFTKPVDLSQWADHLDSHPYLAQIVAQRNAWFGNEIAAGGMLEALDGHRETVDGLIEHRMFFSGNPTVLPRRTFERNWPTGQWSENQFRDRLLENPQTRFAITPDIRVEHVGERSGTGY